MNFDGAQVNYAHWAVSPVSVTWPTSRIASKITLNAMPRVISGSSSRKYSGPWALFHWLEGAKDIVDSDDDGMALVYELDKRRANIEVSGLTFGDRLAMDLLHDFRCPGDK